MSAEAKVARPCVTFRTLIDIAIGAVTIDKTWVGKQIESRNQEEETSTNREAPKDSEGATIPLLIRSDAPFKGIL